MWSSFSGVNSRGQISVRAATAEARNLDKGDSKAQFLADLRRKREERVQQKRVETLLVLIQRVFRGSAARRALRTRLRAEFDAAQGDVAGRLRRLPAFFTLPEDLQRFQALAKALLALGGSAGTAGGLVGHRRRRLALAASATLRHCAALPDAPLGPPLRVLEEFALTHQPSLESGIVDGSLFGALAGALEGRAGALVDADAEASPTAPSPLAAGLLQTAAKALGNAAECPSPARLMRAFAAEWLCGGLVCRRFGVPALAAALQAGPQGPAVLQTLLSSLLSAEESVGPTRLHADLRHLTARLAYPLLALARFAPDLFAKDGASALGLLLALGPSLAALAEAEEGDGALALERRFAQTQLSNPPLVQALVTAAATQTSGAQGSGPPVMGLAEVCSAASRLSKETPLLLARLSHLPHFLHALWASLTKITATEATTSDYMASPLVLQRLMNGLEIGGGDRDAFTPLLATFCALFGGLLATVDDAEFFHKEQGRPQRSSMPFSNEELGQISAVFRDTALSLISRSFPESFDRQQKLTSEYQQAASRMAGWQDARKAKAAAVKWLHLFECVCDLLALLHERDERLDFCPEDFWSAHRHPNLTRIQMLRKEKRAAVELFASQPTMTREELEAAKGIVLSPAELRTLTILRKIPFVVPFLERLDILHSVIRQEKKELGINANFHQGPVVRLTVRRDRLYEDSLTALSLASAPSLKPRLQVTMHNWAGAAEAGIDGGGLSREFLNELLKTGFDPARGFFKENPSRELYPNPTAAALYGEATERHFFLLGRALGKLIYEGQLVELRFAPFFLAQLRGRSGPAQLHELKSLDGTLYNSLCQLKAAGEEVAEWDLDFTLLVDEMGQVRRVELVPGGESVRLTAENRLEYVGAAVDWYLRRQFATATRAFARGLADVLDPDWLGLFAPHELQKLISGRDAGLDVEDLARHTVYHGGYHAEHPVIKAFWAVVKAMGPRQQSALLMFVTSCSRAPLRGFQDLQPPFTIQQVADPGRLPSAATCVCLLKLPAIHNAELLRQKLAYAIDSGAGFELS